MGVGHLGRFIRIYKVFSSKDEMSFHERAFCEIEFAVMDSISPSRIEPHQETSTADQKVARSDGDQLNLVSIKCPVILTSSNEAASLVLLWVGGELLV